MPKTLITIRIPQIDKLKLESMAYKQKTTPSNIIRMLIRQKVNQAGD